MTDDISKFKDEIRKSKSKVITLLYQQRELDPSSEEWLNIKNAVDTDHTEQRRYMLKISIADSAYRAKNYKRERDKIYTEGNEWNDLNWYVQAEVDMQKRLTVVLAEIK